MKKKSQTAKKICQMKSKVFMKERKILLQTDELLESTYVQYALQYVAQTCSANVVNQ